MKAIMTNADAPPRALLWTRVSTDEQTIESQERALREGAEARGWTIVDVKRLEGISAYKDGVEYQAAVAEILQRARSGEFDILFVTALDRLSRRQLQCMNLLHWLSDSGVGVISIRDSWTESMADPMLRKLLASILLWYAEWEVETIRDRTIKGMETAALNGKAIGRKSIREFVDLNYVQRWRERGESWRSIWRSHPRTVPTARGASRRPSRQTIQEAAMDRGIE